MIFLTCMYSILRWRNTQLLENYCYMVLEVHVHLTTLIKHLTIYKNILKIYCRVDPVALLVTVNFSTNN